MRAIDRGPLVAVGLVLGLAWAGSPAVARAQPPEAPEPETSAPVADDAAPAPELAPPSEAVIQIAGWILASGDNGELPYLIVDKVAAQVFAFDAEGHPLGAAPVLVGLATGDDSAPGVGDKALSAIAPEERTTPAGRFVAALGVEAGHHRVLWVDYAAAVSLHAVVTNHPKEHRLERLFSPAPEDHRITFGCINVPTQYFNAVILPTFKDVRGVVYVLPDTKPLDEVFPAFANVAQRDAAADEPVARRRDTREAEPAAVAQRDAAADAPVVRRRSDYDDEPATATQRDAAADEPAVTRVGGRDVEPAAAAHQDLVDDPKATTDDEPTSKPAAAAQGDAADEPKAKPEEEPAAKPAAGPDPQ